MHKILSRKLYFISKTALIILYFPANPFIADIQKNDQITQIINSHYNINHL